MSDEEIDRLGDAIAEFSARIQAATYELLVLIREFDERACWNDGGCLSCAHWLSWRTGLDLGAAREKVRVARALARLPLIGAAMERGELSYSKVRALTRIATPDTESRLMGAAQGGTASHVERLVRAWRRADRLDEARETARRYRQRYLQTWVDEDRMVTHHTMSWGHGHGLTPLIFRGIDPIIVCHGLPAQSGAARDPCETPA